LNRQKYNGDSKLSIVTVSQKGWVVIPAELRSKYGWNSGDRVKVVDYGGIISLVPVLDNPVDEAAGALRTPGRSLLRRLKHVRVQERKNEKRRR
jgi:AbrB family looped-hinge helix DNA binding protein